MNVKVLDEPKAVRELTFRIDGMLAKVLYFRDAPLDRLVRHKTIGADGVEHETAYCELPFDELDDLIFDVVRQKDANASRMSRLIWTDDEEPQWRKVVSGLPESEIEIVANPDFSGLSTEQLFMLQGREFSQFSYPLKIHVFGRLINPIYITHNYPYDREAETQNLFSRLHSEIKM